MGRERAGRGREGRKSQGDENEAPHLWKKYRHLS
jgi:hypothetical protein